MSAVSWLSCSQYIKRCFVHSSLESSVLCQAASISQSSAGPTSQRGAAPLPEIQKFPKFWGGPDADRDGCMRDSCSPKRRRGKGTACPSAPAALCHSSTGSGIWAVAHQVFCRIRQLERFTLARPHKYSSV